MKRSYCVCLLAALLAVLAICLFSPIGFHRSPPSLEETRTIEEPRASKAMDGSLVLAIAPEGQAELERGDPVSAIAILRSKSTGTIELSSLDGEFARAGAQAGEVIEVTLRDHRFSRTRPIRVDADNGGSLNRRIGPIDDLAVAADGTLKFVYALGEHRGRYTVEISQGPTRELLEFWVGSEPSQGAPGPARLFAGDNSQR